MSLSRPLPVPDDQSRRFWEAAKEHVLTAARCSRCGTFSMPPDLTCPHCYSSDRPGALPVLQLSGRAGRRQRHGVSIALACHSSPHFGGAVAYSDEPY